MDTNTGHIKYKQDLNQTKKAFLEEIENYKKIEADEKRTEAFINNTRRLAQLIIERTKQNW